MFMVLISFLAMDYYSSSNLTLKETGKWIKLDINYTEIYITILGVSFIDIY